MRAEMEQAVYAAVAAIPQGLVMSYGDLARLAGFPGYARLVGRIMGDLPPGSSLPWHRVVRADGDLGAPCADRQRQLLAAEGVLFGASGRVRRRCYWRPQ